MLRLSGEVSYSRICYAENGLTLLVSPRDLTSATPPHSDLPSLPSPDDQRTTVISTLIYRWYSRKTFLDWPSPLKTLLLTYLLSYKGCYLVFEIRGYQET